MPKYVRSYWGDEDVTFFWEVAADGWITRSVELVGPERSVRAAASLAEVTSVRDTDGMTAVQAYERRYGVAPEKPVTGWDFPHDVISSNEFERVWSEARKALAGPGLH